MKSMTRNVGLAVAASMVLLLPCDAQVNFQLFESGTSATAAERNPGSLLTLDVVAVSITGSGPTLGNLDSFTYRIVFPNQGFTLMNNSFTAPFDNTLVPGGFNGSIPWSGLPLAITLNADAGSPGATPIVPDIYRTTATTTGTPVSGPNAHLETLTIQVPSPDPLLLPVSYPIRLEVLEAADANGSLHTTFNGLDFTLNLVPEPTMTELATLAFAAYMALRVYRAREQRRGWRSRGR